jgi:hypothetical protein
MEMIWSLLSMDTRNARIVSHASVACFVEIFAGVGLVDTIVSSLSDSSSTERDSNNSDNLSLTDIALVV